MRYILYTFLLTVSLIFIHFSTPPPPLSLLFRCPVFKKLKEEAERRKKPSWKEVKGRNGEVEACAETRLPAAPSRTSTRDHADPGLINPAYEESEEGRAAPFKKNCLCFLW